MPVSQRYVDSFEPFGYRGDYVFVDRLEPTYMRLGGNWAADSSIYHYAARPASSSKVNQNRFYYKKT
jgi:hypothetical protein